MATMPQILAQIRTAIFGKDVRENIAQGIEKCYENIESINTLLENVLTIDDVATVAETKSYFSI